MKKNPSQVKIFFTLIFRTICARANTLFPKTVQIPREIGKYKLEKKLRYKSNWNNYQIAIYKDKTGKKYFAKMWSGRFKDFEYLMLENEKNVLKTLNDINSSKSRQLKIPLVYDSFEIKNAYIVFFEYVNVTKNSLNDKKIKNLYNILNQLKSIGGKVKKNNLIQYRKPNLLLAIYFLNLFTVFATKPRIFLILVRHTPYIINNCRTLINCKMLFLTHKDIHAGNVQNNNSHLYLLDFALCVYTIKYIEEIYMYAHAWNNSHARLEYRKMYERLLRNNEQDCTIFKLSTIIVITHLLTATIKDKKKTMNYINILSVLCELNKSYRNNMRKKFVMSAIYMNITFYPYTLLEPAII